MTTQELPSYRLPSIPAEKAVSIESAEAVFKELFAAGEQAYFHSHSMAHGRYESWSKELTKWRKSHR